MTVTRNTRVQDTTTVLEAIEALGKDTAFNANPSTYSFEYRSDAQFYAERLTSVRRAYRLARAGHDGWIVELRRAFTSGIERNVVERIIDKYAR